MYYTYHIQNCMHILVYVCLCVGGDVRLPRCVVLFVRCTHTTISSTRAVNKTIVRTRFTQHIITWRNSQPNICALGLCSSRLLYTARIVAVMHDDVHTHTAKASSTPRHATRHDDTRGHHIRRALRESLHRRRCATKHTTKKSHATIKI